MPVSACHRHHEPFARNTGIRGAVLSPALRHLPQEHYRMPRTLSISGPIFSGSLIVACSLLAGCHPGQQNHRAAQLAPVAQAATPSQTPALPQSPADSHVAVYLSTPDRAHLLDPQQPVDFLPGSVAGNTIYVDESQKLQPIEGFGASFTDSSAWLLEKRSNPEQRARALRDLFTHQGDGIGLSFMRHPLGASDLALSVYSYDDTEANTPDPDFKHFSIAHDEEYILPLLREVRLLNPSMKLMASPWSAPAWMKEPPSLNGGSVRMTPEMEQAFAGYLVHTVKAYQSAGIPFEYLSLQNEPQFASTRYPTTLMSAEDQLRLLHEAVLPAFRSAGINTRILVWDHNWDQNAYPRTVLNGLSATDLTQVAGIAWHGYGGTPGVQLDFETDFPAMGQYMTEHSGGTWIGNQYLTDFLELTETLRNSTRAFVKWGLTLDEHHGPDLTQNAHLGGCDSCNPLVTINSKTGEPTRTIEFYTLGHYSRFLAPGAYRIYSSNTPSVVSVAFLNPDGSKELVAFNNSNREERFTVQWGSRSFGYSLPAQGAATFVWGGPQHGTTKTNARQRIQASSYFRQHNFRTEITNDLSGTWEMGFAHPGSWLSFRNVEFTASLTNLDLRTASNAQGGKLEVHLDSLTGPTIASVELPVTGGWQTWQTTSVAITPTRGTHDLYLHFVPEEKPITPDPGVSNINWFQFR